MISVEKVSKRWASPPAIALSGALALSGLTACESTPSPTTCDSPPTASRLYGGDTAPGVTDRDRHTWRLGILATTARLPRDHTYVGVVVGFRGSGQAEWQFSKPVKPDGDERIELKLGAGPLQIETFKKAQAGSADCKEAPDTVFSEPQLMAQIQPPGTFPEWPPK